MKCPNCGAVFFDENDHDTGQPTPNQWLCDTFTVLEEQPTIKFTHKTGQLLRAYMLTHADPNAKLLVHLFDK